VERWRPRFRICEGRGRGKGMRKIKERNRLDSKMSSTANLEKQQRLIWRSNLEKKNRCFYVRSGEATKEDPLESAALILLGHKEQHEFYVNF
jgi:hypothetical protein